MLGSLDSSDTGWKSDLDFRNNTNIVAPKRCEIEKEGEMRVVLRVELSEG